MNALIKYTHRLISRTRGRFASLMAIVIVGTAFFVGVSSISSVMSKSVDIYDRQMKLKDITVYSNYGFDEDDVKAISKLSSVQKAEGASFVDVYASSGADTRITRIHSWNPDQEINQFVLQSGRLPEADNEVLVDKGYTLRPGFPLGSTITLNRPDGDLADYLSVDEIIVVGTIDTPLYLNVTRESSTLSNQDLETFIYIPESAFVNDYYTEVNAILDYQGNENSFSDSYLDFEKEIKEAIKELGESQAELRRQKVKDEAMEKYDDGLQEYEDGLAEYEDGKETYDREVSSGQKKLNEAEAKISSGWSQLMDGEQKLIDGERELVNAEQTYTKQIEDGKAQLSDGYRQLEEGRIQLLDGQRQLEDGRLQLEDGIRQYEEGKAQYDAGVRQIEDGKRQLAEGEAQLEDGKRQLAEGEALVEDGRRQLEEGKRTLEENKEEFARKEAEYLAIRALLEEASRELDQPVLSRDMYLSYLISQLCEEGQTLVRALLEAVHINPDTTTVGDVSDYLVANFNDATIAEMNRRIEAVRAESETTVEIMEDGLTGEDLLSELMEQDAEEEAPESDLEETDEHSTAAEALRIENPEAAGTMDTQMDTVPEASEQLPAEPSVVPEVPETPEMQYSPETAAINAEIVAVTTDTETVTEYAAPETEPSVTEETAEPETSVEEADSPASTDLSDNGNEEVPSAEEAIQFQAGAIETIRFAADSVQIASNVKAVRSGSSIRTFGDLVAAMGSSDPTFSLLTRIVLFPDVDVDTGVRMLNHKAAILKESGQILSRSFEFTIPDSWTIGMIAVFKPEIRELRDQLELSDETTIGELKTVLGEKIQEIDDGLAQGRAMIEEAEALIAVKEAELIAGEATLREKRAELVQGEELLNEKKAELVKGEALLKEKSGPLEAAAALIREKQKELLEGEALLAEKEREFHEGEALLNEKSLELAEAESTLMRMLKEGWDELLKGRREYAANLAELLKARKELNDAYLEFDAKKADGLQELLDAEEKLKDAKAELDDGLKKINDMEEAEWMVLDRTQHYASATYRNTINQMKAIAAIFPVFFIAVAALVCLTTMTRLVNEERGQIGVLRALGFNGLQCSFPYLYYAGLSALIGTIVGSVLGLVTFPAIIYNTWRMLYVLPKMQIDIPWLLLLAALVTFVLLMVAVTAYVLYEDMNEVPAAVLRPKAPKLGRQILLEKISLIWNHMSFSWKVTVRNIVRYRQRVIMTVLGVAGCTALLVTGFGISDSINNIGNIQFFQLDKTDGTISLTSAASNPNDLKRIKDEVLALNGTEAVYSTLSYSGKVLNLNEKEEVATVYVFNNAETMNEIFDVRERVGHRNLDLVSGSVIISEKMAENLGIKVGDTITVESSEGKKAEVPVSGIMEMYVYHHLIMNRDTYHTLFGSVPDQNTLYVKMDSWDSITDDYLTAVTDINGVENVSFHNTILDNFNKMVSGINGVVIVLVISSMALAFVVLGNLTNVNISERLREIATLKVLGFREREVQNYIYKENNILVAFGAFVGLPVGILLHGYIMREVELTNVMYGRSADFTTFIFSIGLTILFGLMVNFFMRRKLDNILMVESLKSVE